MSVENAHKKVDQLIAYPVIGSRIAQLVNIPRNIGNGYNHDSGRVSYPDGTFLFYGGITIEGSDGQVINTSKEADANWSVKLNQIPCDSKGNSLMTSYCLSQINKTMRIMVFCKSEPTHRVVLATGEIIDDATDNDYMREMIFSYNILQR